MESPSWIVNENSNETCVKELGQGGSGQIYEVKTAIELAWCLLLDVRLQWKGIVESVIGG